MKYCLLLLCLSTIALGQQSINRQMKASDISETTTIIDAGKSLLIVNSQIRNLKFDSNRGVLSVDWQSSSKAYVWLKPGTQQVSMSAEGFIDVSLPTFAFQNKRAFEINITASGFGSEIRADENLVEVQFMVDQDQVYVSYGDMAPMLSKAKVIPYKLPKGTYTFRFQKDGFADETRTIVVDQPQVVDIAMKAGQSTEKFKLPVIVTITSDPIGAEIILNGQRVDVTPKSLELTAGTHQLELRKALYYGDASKFSLVEGESKSITRTLKPRFGYITVTSNVANAKTTIDGKLQDPKTLTKQPIESARHEIKVDADLYHSFATTLEIKDGDEKAVTAELKPAFGRLEIKSYPENGATVFIDNKQVGVTPYVNEKQPSGDYLVKITKKLFGDAEDRITVNDEKSTIKNMVMSQNFGTLTVTAPEASITLNGTNVGKGSYTGRLQPAKYTVRAERGALYTPAEKDIFIRTGESETIVLKPEPRQGSVSVFVDPASASGTDISVDGVSKGKAPLVLPLLIGDYTITAKHPDFLEAFEKVTVKEREKSTLKFQLMTYDGSIAQRKARWGIPKWAGVAGAVAGVAATFYFNSQANKAYDKYKNAITPTDAGNYRSASDNNILYYKISISVASVSAVTALVSMIVQGGIE